jgi:hypothetical protein
MSSSNTFITCGGAGSLISGAIQVIDRFRCDAELLLTSKRVATDGYAGPGVDPFHQD